MKGKSALPPEGYGSAVREPLSFGKRRTPATITITRGGRARHFTVSPLLFSVTFSLAAMFMVGYLAATAYLFFRDDLIGAAKTRNTQLLSEYQDRIATLRANLDRVTSRQLVDQQVIEAKVDELIRRQEMLRGRSGRIAPLLEEARKHGLTGAIAAKTADRPQRVAGSFDPLETGAIGPDTVPSRPASVVTAGGVRLRGSLGMPAQATTPGADNETITTAELSKIAGRIASIDVGQRELVDRVRRAATARTTRIARVMKELKVPPPDTADKPMGGPFIPLPADAPFASHVKALDLSLERLDRFTTRLDALPVANPAPGRRETSPFGTRIDPFLGRPALHPGIDFAVPPGTPVRASADGTVIDAGRNGGYGNMVEIDHGNGITSRYAHLSRILVKTGEKVTRRTVVGLSGSTGRSTGPHLHFEVRRNGDAVDPARFLNAGRKLAELL